MLLCQVVAGGCGRGGLVEGNAEDGCNGRGCGHEVTQSESGSQLKLWAAVGVVVVVGSLLE